MAAYFSGVEGKVGFTIRESYFMEPSKSFRNSLSALIGAILGAPGDTLPALRSAVGERAAELGGRPGAKTVQLPQPLAAFVDKVALHAYKITDEDVGLLRQSGYSEDAIFELTLSAALGSGMARLERGRAALKAGK